MSDLQRVATASTRLLLAGRREAALRSCIRVAAPGAWVLSLAQAPSPISNRNQENSMTRKRTKATAATTGRPTREGSVAVEQLPRTRRVGEVGRAPQARARERGGDERNHVATLRRGNRYCLSFADCAVWFERDQPVNVTADEARALAEQKDGVVFSDPMRGLVERRLDRFEVRDPEGKLLSGEGFEERVLDGAVETDPFRAAQAAKDAEAAGLS